MADDKDGFSVTSLSVPLILLPLMLGGSWGSFQVYDNLVTEQELHIELGGLQDSLDHIRVGQIEIELDSQHAARCSGYTGNEQTIRRLEAEYFRLAGRPYQRKSCEYFRRANT